jgi:hypothetical protein
VRYIILFAALIVFNNTSLADPSEVFFESGNALYANLSEWNKLTKQNQGSGMEATAGLGYVVGITDGSNGFIDKVNPAMSFCVPKSVSKGQLASIAYKFLDDYPSLRHYPASFSVKLALAKSFPCS